MTAKKEFNGLSWKLKGMFCFLGKKSRLEPERELLNEKLIKTFGDWKIQVRIEWIQVGETPLWRAKSGCPRRGPVVDKEKRQFKG